ncbi:MAG: hypothetical protein ACRENQ_01640 [Gemmatimonadaceae bacterium]
MTTARRTVRDGIVVGLIGYVSVAAWYSVFDLLAARRTLYTVNLLGEAVFRGLRDPGVLQYPIHLDMPAIFLYNALHLVIALAVGLIVTRLVAQAEQHPAQAPAILFTIIAGFVVTVLGVGVLTGPMRSVLPWWSIVLANALASLLAGAYLLRARPGTWHRLVLLAG